MLLRAPCAALLIACAVLLSGCGVASRPPGLGIGLGIGNDRRLPDELEVGGLRVLDHRVDIVVSRTLAWKATVETRRLVTSPIGVMVAQRESMTFDPLTQELALVEAYMEREDGVRVPVPAESVFTRPSEAAQSRPAPSTPRRRRSSFPSSAWDRGPT